MEIKIRAGSFFLWTVIVSFSIGMAFGLWAAALPFVGGGWLVATGWLWISGVALIGLTACGILRFAVFTHADG